MGCSAADSTDALRTGAGDIGAAEALTVGSSPATNAAHATINVPRAPVMRVRLVARDFIGLTRDPQSPQRPAALAAVRSSSPAMTWAYVVKVVNDDPWPARAETF